MTWSKHKLPVPSGFTDFTWKKNRFLSNNDRVKVGEQLILDRLTGHEWWINNRLNGVSSKSDLNNKTDLAQILNNLYERNGYLRRECSKQTFLANHFKHEFDDKVAMLRRKNNIIQQYEFLYETIDEIISYKELPNILHLADLKIFDHNKYYQVLFDNVDGVCMPEIDWDEFKKIGDI